MYLFYSFKVRFIFFCILIFTLPSLLKAQFTSGNVVVLQVGDGSAALSNAATPMLLKEFTPTGTAGITVTIPTTGVNALTTSGTATSEGNITRASNNQSILIPGYNANAGTASIASSNTSTVLRGVGRVTADGNYVLAATTTSFSGNNIRSATSDGTNIWASGAATGVVLVSTGAGTLVSNTFTNLRSLAIYNNQLYVSSGSSTLRLGTVGSGTPTNTGNTITNLPGFPTATTSPYQFAINPTNNIIYVADDRNISSGGGIQKWTFDNVASTWSLAYTLGTGTSSTVGARGLIVDFSGTDPIIYATTAEASGSNRLIKITDTGASSSATTLATSPTNTAFRGVAFSPTGTTTPTVNLSVSATAGNETDGTVITVTATANSAVSGNQTVSLGVTGATASRYTVPNTITILNGQTTGTVNFTVVNDGIPQSTETATLTISNPSSGITLGSTVSQNITITDAPPVANTPPTIVADNENIIDPEMVTPLLSVPNNSPASSPAAFVSGVINDLADPASTIGIEFNINDVETPSSLSVSATSSNTSVVTNANLVLTGTGNSRNLKITPTGVGYSDITVTVSDGSLSASYVIKYAASAASVNPTITRFMTGVSDASTAQALDANYMVVADDENQVIRLYHRFFSGLPLKTFDFNTSLGVTSPNPEVDIESSVMIGNRIYWLGSHSNSASGALRPNRYRLFATDVNNTGIAATLSYVGRFEGLRADLLAWDAANGHGLGANALGFAASAASGKQPEDSNLDGFNIEGLTVAPDGTTGYIAFRAPNVPTSNRNRALIVPWTNMTSLVSGNPTTGTATFGTPIFLDLGGRGIREIKRNTSGQYIIIAGPADAATGTAPKDFRLYTWTGNAADDPILRAANLTALNANGSFESIVDVPASLTNSTQIQLLVDNGDAIFYNDGVIAKDLPQNNFKKFRGEIVELGAEQGIITKIHTVQGSGSTSPLVGQTVTIRGIVVGDFENSPTITNLTGFYVQEEDADTDADPATSEGIFVFEGAGNTTNDVAVGDLVTITGTVAEFTSSAGGNTSVLTQLTSPTIVVNSNSNPLPTAATVQLPVANVSDLERYEGMLVNLSASSGNLAVTETFQLGRFGQIVLAANGASNQTGTDARLDQFTQFNDPSVSGNAAYLAEIAKRRIYLDDGRSIQNPDPIIFGRGGNPLSASNTLRGGDEIAIVAGIMDERFEGYRIQTLTSPNFIAANPRPSTPTDVGGTLKVAGLNLLNYFNGNGSGGGFPTPRGANNLTEFNRQRDKTFQAIINSGADVLGLMEMENDGYGSTSAIQDLVNGLNNIAGTGTYEFVNAGNISSDEITVAIIYKPAKVELVGSSVAIPFTFGNGSFQVVGRRSLAQTFKQKSNNEVFTLVVNHFKSKGSSSGGAGDADAGDGQGLSNGTRTRQAQDLRDWLATNPTGTTDPDYLLIGDFNAYYKEDPLKVFENAGYTNLNPASSYSYVFKGQVG
ncbi:MAG: ExeM/NucH family extracellular endonuclease, partial [Runella sp.]